MKKLEKKQIPQFAALCILSAGVFGYFVIRIVTPSPAAAGTRAPQPVVEAVKAGAPAPVTAQVITGKPVAAGGATTAAAVTTAGAAPAADDAAAPPPTPGMRDPFVIGYVDPKTVPPVPAVPNKPTETAQPNLPDQGKLTAKLNGLPPALVTELPAPALPKGLSGLPAHPDVPPAPALPEAPAAPLWTVTGVLQNDVEKVAILRDGNARRIVHAGDFVDSVYRVVNVTRTGVVLRHSKTVYTLKLGQKAEPVGAPAASAAARTAGLPGAGTLPASSPGLLPVGSPAPDFQLTTLGGTTVSLSQLRGRPVLIDFWATWCPPCQKTMPHIQNLHQEFGGSLAVLSVNTWDERDAMQMFLQANTQYTTTMLLDTKTDNVATGKFRVTGIPTVYLIDKFGRIAGAYVCPSEEMLRQAVLALGAKPAAAPALSDAAPIAAPSLALPALALAQMGRTYLTAEAATLTTALPAPIQSPEDVFSTTNNPDAATEAGKLL